MNQGRKVNDFLLHPVEKNWILAAAWNKCDDFNEDETCQLNKEIFVSFNLGSDWDHIGSYVTQFSWG